MLSSSDEVLYVCSCIFTPSYPSVINDKCRIHPMACHEDPKGEYKFISTLFLTSALDGGEWSTPSPGRFRDGKETQKPVFRRLGGLECRSGRLQKSRPHRDSILRIVQSLASRCIYCTARLTLFTLLSYRGPRSMGFTE